LETDARIALPDAPPAPVDEPVGDAPLSAVALIEPQIATEDQTDLAAAHSDTDTAAGEIAALEPIDRTDTSAIPKPWLSSDAAPLEPAREIEPQTLDAKPIVALPERQVDEPVSVERAAEPPVDQTPSTIVKGEETPILSESDAQVASSDAAVAPVDEPVGDAPRSTAEIPATASALPEPITPALEATASSAPIPRAVTIDQERQSDTTGLDMADVPIELAPAPALEAPEYAVPEVVSDAEPAVDIATLIEAAPVVVPTPTAPLSHAEQEKADREALTHDLAGVIHSVLTTTQFATKAMKPVRYSEPEHAEAVETFDFAEDLAATLPHPVAIRPRSGRLERVIVLASLAMMAMVGYFAFSLWHGEPNAPAKAHAVAAVSPLSEDWGERSRDMARDLGGIAAATEVSKTAGGRSAPGLPKSAAPDAGP
jgi:hypothetical protein